MYKFILPDIGEGVVEAEVIKWHVQEGQMVQENAVLVELMTDKATVEIPSPKSGAIQKLCFAEGAVIKVGQVLLEIDDAVQTSPAPAQPKARNTTAPSQPNAPTCMASSLAKETISTHTADDNMRMETMGISPPVLPPRPHRDLPTTSPAIRMHTLSTATPAVREFARKKGVDINALEGTGPHGRVMRKDIQDFLDNKTRIKVEKGSPPPAPQSMDHPDPADWTRTPMRGLRKAIAQRMSQSVHTAAHYTYVEELDVTNLGLHRQNLLAKGQQISPLAFITRACVEAIKEFPMLNSSLDDERGDMIYKKRIHVGIATATKDGLVVPVINDADQLGVAELSDRISDLAERARTRKLKPEELKNGTFTISSLGKLGGLMATPIINYPQTAIIGIHKIRRMPRYVGEQLQARDMLNMSISLDHRIIDGLEAARFIQAVKEKIEAIEP